RKRRSLFDAGRREDGGGSDPEPRRLHERGHPVPDRGLRGLLLHREADQSAQEARSDRPDAAARAHQRGEAPHADPRPAEGTRLRRPPAAAYMPAPPSTRRIFPVTHEASSEARYTAAFPMSSGSPTRPSGIVCVMPSPTNLIRRLPMSDRTSP